MLICAVVVFAIASGSLTTRLKLSLFVARYFCLSLSARERRKLRKGKEKCLFGLKQLNLTVPECSDWELRSRSLAS